MDSATIEQMNKLRKSLGLPLLGGAQTASDSNGPKFKTKKGDDGDSDEEPASTLETREAAGYANYQSIQDEEKKRLEREKRKKAIQRARELAAREQKLEGKGLGDADEEIDAKAWLKGQKKRQKDIERDRARKLEEELAERERLAAIQYTGSDLAGVQVAHEIGDFDDVTDDQILTLKDQEIGKDDDDEEGDILENADLVAKEKLKERLDAKKKISYDIHDEQKQELLSQYDEKKRKAFTLDAQGSSLEERDSKRQALGEKTKGTISLDFLKPEIISDYQEIKIKKPKKTGKKNKRQREADEDDVFPTTTTANSESMDVDAPKPRSRIESNFVDDEDLSNALDFSRRAALKKKRLRPEDLVKQIQQEEDDRVPETEGGIVLDDTTAFLDNLNTKSQSESPRPVRKSVERESSAQRESTAEREPINQTRPSVDSDDEMPDANQAYTIVEGDEQALLDNMVKAEQAANGGLSKTGLEEEETLSSGLGAALKLLKGRGLVKETDANDQNAIYRDRQRFIAERQLIEHEADLRARNQRERDRAAGRDKGLSTREREENARRLNEQRAQSLSIQAAAAFNKNYKPNVNLKYVDDDGRLLNQKEAFKHMSHQFHGKGSGKQKTEKHLKKLDEEKRRDAKSVLDTGKEDDRGMQRAQGTMGKRDKVAGVRLG